MAHPLSDRACPGPRSRRPRQCPRARSPYVPRRRVTSPSHRPARSSLQRSRSTFAALKSPEASVSCTIGHAALVRSSHGSTAQIPSGLAICTPGNLVLEGLSRTGGEAAYADVVSVGCGQVGEAFRPVTWARRGRSRVSRMLWIWCTESPPSSSFWLRWPVRMSCRDLGWRDGGVMELEAVDTAMDISLSGTAALLREFVAVAKTRAEESSSCRVRRS